MFLAEIDTSQIATLTGLTATPAAIQLVAGGNAVLAVPIAPLVSGKLMKLVVAGYGQTSSLANANTTVACYIGNAPGGSVPQISNSSMFFGSGISSFAFEFDFAWDSFSQQIIVPNLAGFGPSYPSFTNQTDIQFVLAGSLAHGPDSSVNVTVTTFKLEVV